MQRLRELRGTFAIPLSPSFTATAGDDVQRDELLSSSQRRLAELGAAGLGGAQLHLEDVFVVRGPLDVEALRSAFVALAARHSMLRARFTNQAGVSIRIEASPDFRLEILDLSLKTAPTLDVERRASEWARSFIDWPFSLADEPAFRVGLVRFDGQRHWLVTVFHHLVHDRWSRDIVRRELGLFYDHARTGTATRLSAPTLAPIDVARAQHRLLASATGSSLGDWWARELAGVPRAGGLRRFSDQPGSRTRIRIHRRVSPELTQELRRLANRADVGLFVPLLAAHALLLREQGSGDDFVICTPMACREDGRVQGLVGYLANIVVIRVRLPQDLGVATLLERFRSIVEEAYVHQDFPMERLAELAQPHLRVRSLFALQNTPGYLLRLTGCDVAAIELPGGRSDFESFLEVVPEGPGLMLSLAHDSSVISERDACMALERYEMLLQELVTDLRRRVQPAEPSCPPTTLLKRPASASAVELAAALSTRDRTGRVQLVASRFTAQLGPVDLDASLQTLGVGSLALLQLLAAIERELGVALPLSNDLTTVTLGELVERTLDHVELDTMLRRPIELGELPGGRGVDTFQL